MSLLNLQVELQWLAPLLTRLVVAVERIAGPLPNADALVNRRQSTLADYSYIPAEEQERVQVEQDLWARQNMLVPGSDAFVQAVELYEKQIVDSYGEVDGPKLVAQLPWKVRRVDGGEDGRKQS